MAFAFWYDFSSTYSYLSAMRLEASADAAGIPVTWRPFLLGPIFMEAGYGGSPNLMAPAKAAYMWRDLARRARARGHAFVQPETFPFKSVAAARCALALGPDERPAFSRAVFERSFVDGEDVARPETLAAAATKAGLDGDEVVRRGGSPDNKQALFDAVDEAKALGIFGAPTFVTTDGEVFWGDDRMADALAWERTGTLPSEQ